MGSSLDHDGLGLLDQFLKVSLGVDRAIDQAARHRLESLVNDENFGWLEPRLQSIGPTSWDGDPLYGLSCVYDTQLDDLTQVTTYLSVVAPWAAVITWQGPPGERQFERIHTASSASALAQPIVDLLVDAGLQLATDEQCAAKSPYLSSDGEPLNYFELLFQISGYFDSPWDSEL